MKQMKYIAFLLLLLASGIASAQTQQQILCAPATACDQLTGPFNTGTGDSIAVGGGKINANFNWLWGLPSTQVVTSTGAGSLVLSTSPILNSPTLTTPNLGTPSAINLTHGTALPLTALANFADGTILGNSSGGTAAPSVLTALPNAVGAASQNLGNVLYAQNMPGSDMSAKVGYCLSALYTISQDAGVCVANFVGTQSFSFNPFPYAGNYPRTGILKICGTDIIYLYAPFVVPIGWSVEGCGDPNGSAGQASRFQAVPGYFPATYHTGTITSVAGSTSTNDVVTLSGATVTPYMQGANFVSSSFNGTATTTSGSAVMTINSVNFGVVSVGEHVISPGVPVNTTISSLGTSTGGTGTINLSANATANESAQLINLMPVNYTFGIIHGVNVSAGTVTLGYGVNVGSGAAPGDTYVIYAAMVVQGDGDNAGGYYFTGDISHLSLDCNNIAGCIGFENWYSEEGASAHDMSIYGFTNIGFDKETSYAEQSGPYSHFNFGAGPSCGVNTILYVSRIGSTAAKAFEDSSVNGQCGTQIRYGIDVQSANEVLRGLHMEAEGTGIGVGQNVPCPVVCAIPPSPSVAGFIAENINVAAGGGTVIGINKCYGCSIHGTVETAQWTYVLTDAYNNCYDGYVITGTYETGAYDASIKASTTNATVLDCLPQGETIHGGITLASDVPSANPVSASPYIYLQGSYESASNVFAKDIVGCYLYEPTYAIQGASQVNCEQISGSTGYVGWAFDGLNVNLTAYSAAGTAIPGCNQYTGSSRVAAAAVVSDATYATGPYVSGGAMTGRVVCEYNGSTYTWIMQGSGSTVQTPPTIASGFGTSPSVSQNNGPKSFSVNVGTGGTATSGVVTLPTAAHAWACFAADTGTTPTGQTEQTGTSTTTATFTNYSRTAGTALAWTASEIIQMGCSAN